MIEENITLGEIARRLDRIEQRFDSSGWVTGAVYRADLQTQAERDKGLHARLDDVEEFQKKFVWAIVAAFLGLLVEGLVLIMRVAG